MGYEVATGQISLDSLLQPELLEEEQRIYMESQTGALAAGLSCMGFLPYSSLVTEQELQEMIASIEGIPCQTPFQTKQLQLVAAHLRNPKSANIQMILIPARLDFENGISNQSKLLPGPKDGERPAITVAMCLQHPTSRGSIHITSSDPFTQPAIDPACKFS